jgi:RNA recognition motif-containing protein
MPPNLVPDHMFRFRAFGPLRYARITLDKDTGRSRGTGFACFWKREDADMAIEEAEAMAKELGTNVRRNTQIIHPFLIVMSGQPRQAAQPV